MRQHTVTEQESEKSQVLGVVSTNPWKTYLDSIHAVLDAFLNIPHNLGLVMPGFLFARVSYASISLVRLFCTTGAPGGKTDLAADTKVNWYLDRLLLYLQDTAVHSQIGPVKNTHCLLRMLKSWLERDDAKQKLVGYRNLTEGASQSILGTAGSQVEMSNSNNMVTNQQAMPGFSPQLTNSYCGNSAPPQPSEQIHYSNRSQKVRSDIEAPGTDTKLDRLMDVAMHGGWEDLDLLVEELPYLAS